MGLAIFVTGLLLLALAPVLTNNLSHVNILRGESASISVGSPQPSFSCQDSWLKTMALRNAGGQPQDATWETFLSCGPDYLPLLQGIQPNNRGVADQASILYPENAQVWFWVGEIDNSKDQTAALVDYQKAVSLNPSMGVAWCRIGRSLENSMRTQDAVNAFLNCCRLGDAGENGCFGAGRMEEKLGNPQKAIEYYRLSFWDGALKRAAELEKQLNP